MSSDILGWPAPIDDATFESLCLDLWTDLWGPGCGAQKNGRSGQPQAGVDVFGKAGEVWVGVQCKQRDNRVNSRLTVSELKAEALAAQTFEPRLGLFIVATTGPRDEKVQACARKLSDAGPFPVEVWFWEDILTKLGERPKLLRRISWKYWPTIFAVTGGQKIAPTRLTHVAEELFGRETELADLDAAWKDSKVHVVTVVAWGGVGKTSLVAHWAAQLAARDHDGADYFDWSFYSQGTQDAGAASGETFLAAGLRFFGGEEGESLAASPRSAEEKGTRLAEFVARRKALLILDGLEPLQYSPSSPLAGQLKDPGVKTLLKSLAQKNPGLCLVTTREKVADLAGFARNTAPEWSLERLSMASGGAARKASGEGEQEGAGAARRRRGRPLADASAARDLSSGSA